MGTVPIFIALVGLVLLYSIFTYNQIKPLKAAFTLVIDDMANISRERKNLILTYDRENENSALNEVAKELMKTSTDRFQSYRKENDLISKTNQGAMALEPESSELREKIQSLNSQQEEKMKLLEQKANAYNTFIKKAPQSMVASLFGFRPF